MHLALWITSADISIWWKADSSPVPLTPDYGGPVVSYADGVFDARFDRYVTVQEGRFFYIMLV